MLRGWLLRPPNANGDASLLLHGLGDNRLGMSGYAQMLLARGYAVLLPDARGHGESGGNLATYGLLERHDIQQWVDYLQNAVHPHCVYGLGESMGAAQLLQSLEVEKRFCAVVAESSFSTFREIAYDRMGQPFGLGPWVGRIALTSILVPRSIITHCGCSESSSPVKGFVRYGLLFQYDFGSPSVNRDQPFPSPRLKPRWGSGAAQEWRIISALGSALPTK